MRLLLAVVLAAGPTLSTPTALPAPTVVPLAATAQVPSAVEPTPVLVVPAPARAPWVERWTAQACPELVPSAPGGRVRRVAARTDDEPAPVTQLRRACSQVRSGLAALARTPVAPTAEPEALRRSVSAAVDQAAVERAATTLVAPAPRTGGASGCRTPDPTGGGGCVTDATRHGLAAVQAAFGPLAAGPTIRSASCWDEHAWNPTSDHPRGRACDLFPGTAGAFPDEAEQAAGWRVAEYLRTHAAALDVAYLIWQGRYWDPSVADAGGWGKPYSSGVYDTADVTGGHYDHVHVSFAE
jgi:hypothetical protein